MRTRLLTPLHYLLAVFALGGMLTITACGAGTGQSSAQLPPGTYTTTITPQDLSDPSELQGNWEITFTNDSFTAVLKGEVQVAGTIAVKQDQVTLTDKSGPGAGIGADAAGTYKWSFDGKALTLTKVQDANPSRTAVLTSHPLQLKSTAARLSAIEDNTVASTRVADPVN